VIRWGILGTGRIAGLFVEGLRAVPDAVVAAVGSRTDAGAGAFGERHGIPRRHGSYQALAEDPEVDVVYVAVPHSGHQAETLRCLRAGKAVLCEKPFALNAGQAAEMVATARERGLFLMEAMWTRYLPAVVRVRELLAEGAIGDPRLLVTDLGWRFPADPASRLYAPELGGGALLDLGVYGVSFASMLFGPPVSVTAAATMTTTGVDAQTAVAAVHDTGRVATTVCTLEAATTPLATITGTGGRIDIRRWFNPADFTLTVGDGPGTTFEYPRDGNGMEYEAREVQRCLRAGLPESPVMPLDESVQIMGTLDRVRSLLGVRYPGE
jgi:predicted dehydrogenase